MGLMNSCATAQQGNRIFGKFSPGSSDSIRFFGMMDMQRSEAAASRIIEEQVRVLFQSRRARDVQHIEKKRGHGIEHKRHETAECEDAPVAISLSLGGVTSVSIAIGTFAAVGAEPKIKATWQAQRLLS
eukprot:CAMPEP_0115583172 /NCGR_PEP_ID=MMETSP0272-20121206/6036_1 /TAXON_ID=71861 /ORGANISM="Scrippsiella trochoidea, Strain CCMP3099" /LENGTH=128 /DNA_ID=CAMNT_0003018177 /DNA_START=567 /DNA_END=951 /DNA_ORIENTATION=+